MRKIDGAMLYNALWAYRNSCNGGGCTDKIKRLICITWIASCSDLVDTRMNGAPNISPWQRTDMQLMLETDVYARAVTELDAGPARPYGGFSWVSPDDAYVPGWWCAVTRKYERGVTKFVHILCYGIAQNILGYFQAKATRGDSSGCIREARYQLGVLHTLLDYLHPGWWTKLRIAKKDVPGGKIWERITTSNSSNRMTIADSAWQAAYKLVDILEKTHFDQYLYACGEEPLMQGVGQGTAMTDMLMLGRELLNLCDNSLVREEAAPMGETLLLYYAEQTTILSILPLLYPYINERSNGTEYSPRAVFVNLLITRLSVTDARRRVACVHKYTKKYVDYALAALRVQRPAGIPDSYAEDIWQYTPIALSRGDIIDAMNGRLPAAYVTQRRVEHTFLWTNWRMTGTTDSGGDGADAAPTMTPKHKKLPPKKTHAWRTLRDNVDVVADAFDKALNETVKMTQTERIAQYNANVELMAARAMMQHEKRRKEEEEAKAKRDADREALVANISAGKDDGKGLGE